MSINVISPPPDNNDLFDVGNIQATLGANGKVVFAPGSFRPSAVWRIWLDGQFVVDRVVSDTATLEALDEGAGDNSASRDATDALLAGALSEDSAGQLAALRQQARSVALAPEPPDYSRRIRNLELLVASLAEWESQSQAIRNLRRSIETQGDPSQRNWSVVTGTHAARLLTPANGPYLKRAFFETDRNALYVSIANVWTFMSGIMVAVAADQPADLGLSDTFFGFIASDTLALSYWTGSAWASVSAPPSGPAGGRLTGMYPDPALADSGVTAATYGDSTHVAQVIISADGTISFATDVPISFPGTTGFTGTLAAAVAANKNVVNGLIQP